MVVLWIGLAHAAQTDCVTKERRLALAVDRRRGGFRQVVAEAKR